MLEGVADEGRTALEAELFHAAGLVRFDGACAEEELLRDLLRGMTESNQAQHLCLALREGLGAGRGRRRRRRYDTRSARTTMRSEYDRVWKSKLPPQV